jgi:catechol 2,3-dioxygenase
MRFQGVVVNVEDLGRSMDFYRDVLGFSILSQQDRLAAMGPADAPTQAIVLRALGSSPLGGAGHVGVRVFLLEADSASQLDLIGSRLDERRLLIGRRDHSDWSAVVGRDPDGVTMVAVWHPDGRAADGGWEVLDDFLYGIGE